MEYIELNISVADAEQSEIVMALLSDYPFEAFDEAEGELRCYIQISEWSQCRKWVESMLLEQELKFAALEVEQQNWNAEWEESFEPVEVKSIPPIRIRAPHHQAPVAGVIDVVIAPRMSFGTGHHTTTALMTAHITSIGVEGLCGLDMGCGTGVLAIAALKCGAEKMTAVDIDDWACDSCRDSIALSGVADKVDVRCGSIDVVAGETYDFILANINRNILLGMMPSFAEALSKGGKLLMSGFFIDDAPAIEAAAAEYGFKVAACQERDGWAVMYCVKH